MKRILLFLTGLGLALYGLHCAIHMKAFIGSGHYWSNPWFYKAHASLFALIILRLLTPLSKREQRIEEQEVKG
jgi:hypothetical protein